MVYRLAELRSYAEKCTSKERAVLLMSDVHILVL